MSTNRHTLPELHALERLTTLEMTALMDSTPEEEFDRFTRLASTILQTPVALVSLVDEERQFFKSAIGLAEPVASERETPLSHSFCKHVVATSEPLVVTDARIHPILHDNLAIPELGVIAYLGIPLTTSQGHTLGSFCVIDAKPRKWTEREIAIIRDLAALVMTKIELRLLAKNLQTDYLKLRNLQLHRDEMIQMLVHDLRNPLTSFLSGLELTERVGELTSKQKKYVTTAQRGGETLLQMVNNILDASKAEVEHLELDRDLITAGQALDVACTQMAPLAEKARIRLKSESVDVVPFWADVNKLRRVLVNLIGNAIQHTPPGGSVTLSAQIDDITAIRFTITDTGCGIPSDAYEQIFQTFGQVKTERVQAWSSGLGLPFSRMVIEAHGGEIWLESELGHGTSFYFTIPLTFKHGYEDPQ